MYKITKRESQIPAKDHKDDFRNNPKCRLVNLTKTELGQASRKILRAKIEIIKQKSQLNSLKDGNCAKKWFTNISQKHTKTVIRWDFTKFYPSITKDLLEKEIEHARKYVEITEEEVEILMQARKAILIHQGKAWEKKEGDFFDVTIGSLDGADCASWWGSMFSPSWPPSLTGTMASWPFRGPAARLR